MLSCKYEDAAFWFYRYMIWHLASTYALLIRLHMFTISADVILVTVFYFDYKKQKVRTRYYKLDIL